VIEYYSDSYSQDAEWNVRTLWPDYGYGEGAWHEIAITNLAEENGKLAYSHEKADQQKIEQTSLVGGPSLPILAMYLDQAASDGYIPYVATLGKYITANEAKDRYSNLKTFAANHGHYWIGTGPYLFNKVFLTEKSLVLKNNIEYPDTADRWSSFGEPKIAVVALDGPDEVKIGTQASFDVSITFKNQAYPASEIKTVKYLFYNAKNELVSIGEATLVTDGQYKIVLPPDLTSKLEAGSNHIEVAVTALPVSVPVFESHSFRTIQ
jgi:peptide/nickel transport system substrate-binding protein